jgi:hypothetical protein
MLIGNEIRVGYGMIPWSTRSRVIDIVLVGITSSVVVFLSGLNGFTDIAVDNLGTNVWFYLINGTLGTSVVFIIASLISSRFNSIRENLSQLGNISQEVYEFHPLTFILVPPILLLLGWTLGDIQTNFDIFWSLRFTLGLIVSIVVAIFVIRKNRLLSIVFTGSQQRSQD